MDGVGEPQQQAYDHLHHAQDHGGLHFHRVHVDQLILRAMPCRVDTEWIRTGPTFIPSVEPGRWLVGHNLSWLSVSGRHLPPRVEERKADGEKIVVEEPDVDGEEPHHEQNIPCIVQLGVLELDVLGAPDGINADKQQHGSMAHVPVHHAEQEWEGDHCEERRVRLPVPRQAVGVDELLEDARELVLPDEGRRGLRRGGTVRDEHRAAMPMSVRAVPHKERPDLLAFVRGVPAIRAQVHVTLEKVEGGVD
mmetsp:Transcript_55500/g.160823  ORF Transcript_55500/g.160823 Transcript_55500/m.160823 type:complete len:250 (+) Transcript_55500:1020-1769(+)